MINQSQPAANDPDVDPVLTFARRHLVPLAVVGGAVTLSFMAGILSL